MDSPELKLKEKIWSYNDYRDYLLAISRGEHFLLLLDQYPKEIELSKGWHETLNTMRNGTNKDKTEHVSVVAFSQTARTIYLPSGNASGWEPHQVNPLATMLQIIMAKLDPRIEGYRGMLHSHPSRDTKIFGISLPQGRLSAGDIHIALTSPEIFFVGVADGGINSLAFRTRDSIKPSVPQDKFYDLWEREPQLSHLDILLTEKYKLALYKGGINQPLKRVSPK